MEYYIKWVGFEYYECTWEPENNLDCKDMILEFENNTIEKINKSSKEAKKIKNNPKQTTSIGEENSVRLPLDRKKIIEKIISATNASGQLLFLIKWKDCILPDLLPAKDINLLYPRDVIHFYEEILNWPNN